MIEDNWDLVTGNAAHEIEVLNYSNQVNVIDALVHLLMHHHTAEDGGCASPPNENVLREFHRTATLFLLNSPGSFREVQVHVRAPDGTVIHTPPEPKDVQVHIDQFFEELQKLWPISSAQALGAYSLWMINWIHPFKNGNGRTARAFCYACLSLKLGFVLPGKRTVIDLVMRNRAEYQANLKKADLSFEAGGKPDLGDMEDFIDRLLAEQLNSALD
jgi:Fic family protein